MLNHCVKIIFYNFLCVLQRVTQNPAQLAVMSNLLLEASAKATSCKVWNVPFTHLERSGLKSPGSGSSNGDVSCFDKYSGNKQTILCPSVLILVPLPQFVKMLCFKGINTDKNKGNCPFLINKETKS